ncbi:MAG TPA: hypothetical protein VE338_19375 [Ktedonobacterales bacterium]|nr:hypothetical protein [Ktedonobacterales bacterium]
MTNRKQDQNDDEPQPPQQHLLGTVAAPTPAPRVTADAYSRKRYAPIHRRLSKHLVLLALVVCIPLAQIAALLTAIWRQTPRVPWGDEWNLVLLAQRQDAGTLSIADFWALHNRTHRIVLPRLADLMLVDVSHWNRQVMMTFDLGVAVAAGGLLLACMFSTLRSRRIVLTLLIPLSLLYFSFAQYENWFFPWQLTFIATILGICCCLYGFHRRAEADRQGQRAASWQGFALALLGAVIASLSSFGGLCVWLAFLPSAARSGRMRTGVWVAVALVIGVPYVIGIPHQSPTSPLHLAAFFVAALGAPVASLNLTEARLFGILGLVALGLALYAASRLSGELRRLEVWIELAACSILATAVTALGRASYGNGLALLSRYQEFSQLWWIALAVIGAVVIERIVTDMRRVGVSSVLPDPRHVRWAVAGGIALLLICTAAGLASDVTGARAADEWLGSMRAQQSCMLQTPSPSAKCFQLFILEGQIPLSDQQLVDYLYTHHLALFDQ